MTVDNAYILCFKPQKYDADIGGRCNKRLLFWGKIGS